MAQGLTFAPTAPPNPFTLFLDLNRFIRNITVKRYFNIQASKNSNSNDTDNSIIPSESSTAMIDPLEFNALEDLEDLYTEDLDDYFEALTQHQSTSPPIRHTKFKPKSIFNPTFAKGPSVQSFYQVVYADIPRLCQ